MEWWQLWEDCLHLATIAAVVWQNYQHFWVDCRISILVKREHLCEILGPRLNAANEPCASPVDKRSLMDSGFHIHCASGQHSRNYGRRSWSTPLISILIMMAPDWGICNWIFMNGHGKRDMVFGATAVADSGPDQTASVISRVGDFFFFWFIFLFLKGYSLHRRTFYLVRNSIVADQRRTHLKMLNWICRYDASHSRSCSTNSMSWSCPAFGLFRLASPWKLGWTISSHWSAEFPGFLFRPFCWCEKHIKTHLGVKMCEDIWRFPQDFQFESAPKKCVRRWEGCEAHTIFIKLFVKVLDGFF